MRKLLICLGLIVLLVLCYFVFVQGFEALSISSYETIVEADKTLETKKSELNRKNTDDYNSKVNALNTAVKKYKNTKEEYEALVPSFTNSEVTLSVKPYDVEFLWTIIGNYATEEGIGINLDFVSSISNAANKSSDEYIIADMNYAVTGTYNSVIEFLYDLEDDDRLGFEIRDFKMAKGGEGVQATFSVQEIPITNYNLSSLSGGSGSGATSSNTPDEGPGTNPAGPGTAVENTTTTNTTTTNTTTTNTTTSNTTTANTAAATNTSAPATNTSGNSANTLNY